MKIIPEKFRDSIRERIEQKLAFNKDVDYKTWRESVKEKFLSLIGYENIKSNACPLNFEIESEVVKDGYKQIRFTIESEKDCIVPVYILIPDTNKEKYPVAITLQGHTTGFHISIDEPKDEGDKQFAQSNFAIQAVKRGYIAVAIEQRGMGERRPTEHLRYMAPLCMYEAMTAIMMGRTLIGERIWDISKVIDSLCNFPQCDLEDIFITGNSGGGTASYYAACVEERIKLSAPSCAVCNYKGSILDIFHCSCNHIPDIFNWFEMGDVSCLIAPRKLVVINGKKDVIFPIEYSRMAFDRIKEIYEAAGVPENCALIETEKDHYWCEELVWEGIQKMRGEI